MPDPLALGFIGLGDMGGPIAEHILEAGHALGLCDLRAEAVAHLVARGGRAAASPATLAAESDVLFLCVVDDKQVLSLSRDHLVGAMRSGSVLVILSSVRPDTMHQLQALFDGRGVELLDCPVSGSRPAAAAGTLTLIIGGDTELIDRLRPVLECFSERIFHTGPLGSGQAMKIANNVMLHMNHLVALEAVRFARAQGIAEEKLIEVANTSSGRSWVTETWGLIDDMFRDHPQAGTPGIYEMMVKEMWNSVLLSRGSETWLPLTGLGLQVSRAFYEERERQLGIVPADERD
ncbi:NAD(P)-dependent oxidoreductase [Rhizorhabdus dicambivorans]|uniref:NAD(P)-dependent oxidoreductase n=1 Tax=Rhizorhabdus dicambivorans TaxID=1850238 RepID=A0A2A4FWD6_9SPHN|nr:NAD(P)-dependent oxidoreductase [Rhizorhabdus dicambivorans]ATE64594.1 NAD(P)-dependent oxidoreductase [Rhizorhabdus dicambivorans]PCE41691.1 NAD(P)-dependent oxidoreductase [Rhizorhabdus dicambivorans]